MFGVISRDGLKINQFLELHNLLKSDVRIIKCEKDLVGMINSRYVVIPPIPPTYNWRLKPILHMNGCKNVTREYNLKQTKF